MCIKIIVIVPCRAISLLRPRAVRLSGGLATIHLQPPYIHRGCRQKNFSLRLSIYNSMQRRGL